jgi:hypothetical protein
LVNRCYGWARGCCGAGRLNGGHRDNLSVRGAYDDGGRGGSGRWRWRAWVDGNRSGNAAGVDGCGQPGGVICFTAGGRYGSRAWHERGESGGVSGGGSGSWVAVRWLGVVSVRVRGGANSSSGGLGVRGVSSRMRFVGGGRSS